MTSKVKDKAGYFLTKTRKKKHLHLLTITSIRLERDFAHLYHRPIAKDSAP